LVVAAKTRVLEVLLVEDRPADSRLTLEAIRDRAADANLSVVRGGAEALAFLRRRGAHSAAPRPAIILLDLDLPGKSGLKILAEIKHDPDLRRIPVVVFATAQSADDIQAAYSLYANCYISKPADASQLTAVVRCIEEFWLTRVRLPTT